ncbi:winged helix-turn-helix domain-containing protein [bacterium]|nr:MAG: winged helix-turn-helix domain-containing protein [bacterium]
MAGPIKLTKVDARRALVRHHFDPAPTLSEAFHRLGSVQFDPIAPVGCNHDLVLQARVPDYRIGDWERAAYRDRAIYDGWDKQASLIPFEGWPWRRIFHHWQGVHADKLFAEHGDLAEAILREIEVRGPLMPKDSEFRRRVETTHSWHSPNLAKQVLRALWHTGKVMTSDRKAGQHVYDLTERVVPAHLLQQPVMSEEEAVRTLVYERHRAVGLLRFSAPYEVWSYSVYAGPRAEAIKSLIDEGHLVEVDVEGVRAHATPAFLAHLDKPPLDPRVIFVGPLDQILWDRKMIQHAFGFDYSWEIYTPEAKRRWGYYVLPVLYGDAFAARAEFYARNGVLEVRRWIDESKIPKPALRKALKDLMRYSSTQEIRLAEGVSGAIAGAI